MSEMHPPQQILWLIKLQLSFKLYKLQLDNFLNELKCIVQPKKKKKSSSSSPKNENVLILRPSKVDEFVSSWFGETWHYITCSPVDPLQWMGAVRMSPNSW